MPKQPDMNDPAQAAEMMYGAGIQLGAGGGAQPTRDFGSLLRLNSSQMNSLSRGAKPGSFSSLGQPMNSMYANNPGFFNREGRNNFAGQLAQRNTSLTPGAPVPAAPEKPAFSLSSMLGPRAPLAAARNPTPGQPNQTPAPQTAGPTPETNRAGLEDRAAGLRLLREMSQTPLQIVSTPPTWDENGYDTLTGKYGTGVGTIKDPKKEGLIGGRPFSEVMQGLANKQVREGTWREGDRLPNAAAGEESSSYDRNTRAGMRSEDQAKKANEESRQTILSRQRTKK
jgi:hypothetical protein